MWQHFKCSFFSTLDKSTDSELENGISCNAGEEQCESNSVLNVDKLVTPLLRKCTLNVLVHLLESSSLSRLIQHCPAGGS